MSISVGLPLSFIVRAAKPKVVLNDGRPDTRTLPLIAIFVVTGIPRLRHIHRSAQYFAEKVVCRECGAAFPVKDFSQEDIRKLENEHYYHHFCEEMAWLRRVASFYDRHPSTDVKSHHTRVMQSKDPKIREAIVNCVPFHEIELPPDGIPTEVSNDWSTEDLEVVDYLRHNEFSLPGRMKFVEESIDRLVPIVKSGPALCPDCRGRFF